MSVVDQAAAKMEENIAKNTGKTVAEWVSIAQKAALKKHGQIVKFLKTEHGFTHGYANLVAHRTLQSSADHHEEDELVDTQYSGPKADLKPIYNKLLEVMKNLGPDLEVAPKKAYVSFRRKKQFALVQPSTKTRVDLGINIKGKSPEGRLEASGSFNSMVSHRVRLTTPEEVDAEIVAWLKEGFDAAG